MWIKNGIKISIPALQDGFRSPGNIAASASSGTVWLTIQQLIIFVLGFLRGIILARLLSPTEFGLIGMVLPIYSGLQAFSNIGTTAAIIHQENSLPSDLNAAWTMQLLRGALLSICMFVLAPLVAMFFQEPSILPLMSVMGISLLIQGSFSMSLALLQKEMDFRKIFIVQGAGAITDFVVSIAIAYFLKSVWAFVIAAITSATVISMASYIIHAFRPRLSYDFARMRSLMHYGKWVLIGQAVVFGATEGDDLLVGRLFGSTALGYYRMSYFISNIPATQITNVISQITFPAFEKVKKEPRLLKVSFLTAIAMISSIGVPLGIGLLLIAPSLVAPLLGQEWEPIVPLIRILALWGILRSIGSISAPLFQAIGEPKLVTTVTLVQFVSMLLFIVLFFPTFQLNGVAYSVLGAGFIQVPINYMIVKSRLGLSIGQLLRAIAPSIIGAVVMALFIYWLQQVFPSTPVLWSLLMAKIIGGGIIYLIVALGLHLRINMSLIENLMGRSGNLKEITAPE